MRTINIITVLIFIMVIAWFPVTALAEFKGSLSLDPVSGTLNKGCSYPIKVVVDTNNAETDGTDAIIFYDASRFSITSTDITSGTGTYADFPGSNVDEQGGKITISGLASVTTPFTGRGTLATLNFKVKDNAGTGATIIKFDYDPNFKNKTTDSNIVQRNTIADILNSVVNGNYTIGTGTCVGVTPSPGAGGAGGGRGGPGGSATQSGSLLPTVTPTRIPVTTGLPDGGTSELTSTLAILGGVLTVLGILGLALL